MAEETAILSKLPPFKWRGEQYPVTSARYGFSHQNAEQKVSFRGVTLVQPAGARNPTFRYSIALVGKGEFPKINKLEADLRNKAADTLIDPIFGEFICVPVSFESETRAERQNMVTANIEFMWSPDLDEQATNLASIQQLSTDLSLINESAVMLGKLDADLLDLNDLKAFADPFGILNGVLSQIERQLDKLGLTLDYVVNRTLRLEDAAMRAQRTITIPELYRVPREMREIRIRAYRFQRNLRKRQLKVYQYVTKQREHFLNVARQFKMSAAELMGLNPFLLMTGSSGGVLNSGTAVKVYSDRPL